MIWLLVLQLVFARVYHPVAIARLATSHHTHVQIAGLVTLVRAERDGDVHFRVVDDQGRFVVCELIPALSLARPRVGQRVIVRGIRRFDDERGHGYAEVHPVEAWEVQQ